MPATNNSRSQHWVFTINNYTQDDVDHLIFHTEPQSQYLVFGREVGESGTPHLQGFCSFKERKRFASVQVAIGPRAYVATARGSPAQASEYCKKEGDYEEFGDCPSPQGKRSDWERFREWVVELGRVPSVSEICSSPHLSLYGRYAGRCLEVARALVPPTLVGPSDSPRLGWQTAVAGRASGALAHGANDRTIDFVVDPTGNSGKSWLVRYLMGTFPNDCQVLSIGKRDDLAHAINETKRLFLFDVPRQQMTYLQYPILEMLKDRIVFSPKYCSGTKILSAVPHVIVFSNEEPDMERLTQDRYHIIRVGDTED